MREYVEPVWLRLAEARQSGAVAPIRRQKDLQQLRIRLRIHVAASLEVQEAVQLRGVNEVPVNAHGESERRVDVEWLRLFSLIYRAVENTEA